MADGKEMESRRVHQYPRFTHDLTKCSGKAQMGGACTRAMHACGGGRVERGKGQGEGVLVSCIAVVLLP